MNSHEFLLWFFSKRLEKLQENGWGPAGLDRKAKDGLEPEDQE
jgi:hypothetical protein